jgi:hypothetical protein
VATAADAAPGAGYGKRQEGAGNPKAIVHPFPPNAIRYVLLGPHPPFPRPFAQSAVFVVHVSSSRGASGTLTNDATRQEGAARARLQGSPRERRRW